MGDTKTRDLPTLVESLKEYIIVGAATGRSHTLFLTERGTVFSVGDNKNGQLGIGSSTIQVHFFSLDKKTPPFPSLPKKLILNMYYFI